MADKIILKQEHTEVRDGSTGEVLETSVTQTVKVAQEPSFVKLYVKDMCKLNDIPKTANSVLNALLELCNYDNEIVLNSHIKQKICDKIGIKMQGLNNSITKLNNSNFIDRIGRGTYKLNPHFFGKGKWQDIRELQVTWDYSSEGRKLEEVKTSTTSQPALTYDDGQAIDAEIE